MQIRSESLTDESDVTLVLESAFPTHAEALLVRKLRENDHLVISLVCVVEGRIVGHIGFSPVTMNGETLGLGLAPVAVDPRYQNQGIGSELVTAGLRLARDNGYKLVVVLGEPAYYSRFGFMPARNMGLEDEYDGGDAFQAIKLVSEIELGSGGVVRYGQEFSAV